MSRLIKSYDTAAAAITAHVLPAPAPAREPPPVAPAAPANENVVSLELLSLRAEAEALSKRLEQAEAEKARLQADIARALQEGEERGRKAGLKEGQDYRAAALERLDGGLAQAMSAFSDSLEALERLAPLLAREGVARMLGSAAQADLVTRVIQTQIGTLDAQAVVRVRVSRADFPEPEDLERLRGAADLRTIAVEAVDELKPGDCRIRLCLGELDVGVGQQWTRLDALLQDLAAPAAAP